MVDFVVRASEEEIVELQLFLGALKPTPESVTPPCRSIAVIKRSHHNVSLGGGAPKCITAINSGNPFGCKR